MKEQFKKIDNKYVRLFALIVVAINSGAMMLGYELLPFSNEDIVAGLSIAAMVVVELWNHWKNNSYTTAAKQADEQMKLNKKKGVK